MAGGEDVRVQVVRVINPDDFPHPDIFPRHRNFFPRRTNERLPPLVLALLPQYKQVSGNLAISLF